ncbi:hypothetical protein, partial [Enterococcus saccharolyticus]
DGCGGRETNFILSFLGGFFNTSLEALWNPRLSQGFSIHIKKLNQLSHKLVQLKMSFQIYTVFFISLQIQFAIHLSLRSKS